MAAAVISLLCPTRGRWELLRQSLDSAESRRAGAAAVEYLIAHDPGDIPPDLPWPAGTRFWQAPERFGYRRLHEYYNALAEKARGDWLLIWNDDARMRTTGWDQVIESQPAALLRLNHVGGPAHCNPFPAVPGAWARHLGHLSLDPYADTWLQQLAESLGVQRPVPVDLDHDELKDATFAEGRAVTPLADYARDGLLGAWRQDQARLAALLGRSAP